jgi:hypothetical protein
VLQDLVKGIEKPHSEIALAAVNVVVRMIPIQKNPFYSKKSFFKAMQARSIGGGLELAEGWFQLSFFTALTFLLVHSSFSPSGVFALRSERCWLTWTQQAQLCM